MRLKNIAFGRAHVRDDATLDFLDLLAGLDKNLFEALGFRRDFRFGQITPGNDVTGAVQDKNFPATNAGGNGDAAKHFFSFGLRRHKSHEEK